MADINRVILVGRLTRNAELKYTNNGSAVSRFGIAINQRRKKDDQWVDEAHFFDVVVWGKTAESLTQYLLKGKQVGVEGQLRQDRWEQEGQSRSKVKIVATNIMLLGSGGGSGRPAATGTDAHVGGAESPEAGPPGPDHFEDDIPF